MNEVAGLMELTDGHGYDDVFVYVPIKSVAEVADKVMAFDGCMNLFAGSVDNQFSAEITYIILIIQVLIFLEQLVEIRTI